MLYYARNARIGADNSSVAGRVLYARGDYRNCAVVLDVLRQSAVYSFGVDERRVAVQHQYIAVHVLL